MKLFYEVLERCILCRKSMTACILEEDAFSHHDSIINNYIQCDARSANLWSDKIRMDAHFSSILVFLSLKWLVSHQTVSGRLLSSPNKQSGKYNEVDPILIGTAVSEHVIREMSKPAVPLVKALPIIFINIHEYVMNNQYRCCRTPKTRFLLASSADVQKYTPKWFKLTW